MTVAAWEYVVDRARSEADLLKPPSDSLEIDRGALSAGFALSDD